MNRHENATYLLRTTNRYMTDIAAECGLSVSAVSRIRRKEGLRRLSAEALEKVTQEYEQHCVNVSAATSLVVSGQYASYTMRMFGLSQPVAHTIASRHRDEIMAEGETEEVYIYALACPLAKQAFYVGSSRDPWKRYDQHMAAPGSQEMADWIERLAAQKKSPKLKILSHLNTARRFEVERAWIDALLAAGHPLMNREGR